MTENKTNFGFKQIDFEEKRGLINHLFASVSGKYDLMNDIMSAGLHRLWKEQFCKQISNLNSRILDVASGTGDIAFKIKEMGNRESMTPTIVLCDPNPDMLEVAKSKGIDKGFTDSIEYVVADAEKLPFEDNSFDYYTISFGIRNVPNMQLALSEALRVLKPMGKFLCMEFSHPESPIISTLYDAYAFNVIPKIGKFITQNEDAYRYLAESVAMFPGANAFKNMIEAAGFSSVSYSTINFGIVAIHSGYKF